VTFTTPITRGGAPGCQERNEGEGTKREFTTTGPVEREPGPSKSRVRRPCQGL